MEEEKSTKSYRNHLPKKQRAPIEVPYNYSNFMVNQVERKRFCGRAIDNNPEQIKQLQQVADRMEKKQREQKKTPCINLDD